MENRWLGKDYIFSDMSMASSRHRDIAHKTSITYREKLDVDGEEAEKFST